MATTKTLTPTGQTVTIAEMTDRPNNSVDADGISKLVDAANTLDINIGKKTNTIYNGNIIGDSSHTIDVSSSPICLICIGRGASNLTPVILFRDYWGMLLNITASDPNIIVSNNNGQITIQNRYGSGISVMVIGG